MNFEDFAFSTAEEIDNPEPIDSDIKSKTLSILKGQLLGSAAYIIVLILSIVLLYNQILGVQKKEKFIDPETSSQINLLNRVIVLLLVLYFLYTSYENLKTAEQNKKDTEYLTLQFIASLLTVVSAIIVLYVAFKQSNKAFVPLSATENPNL